MGALLMEQIAPQFVQTSPCEPAVRTFSCHDLALLTTRQLRATAGVSSTRRDGLDECRLELAKRGDTAVGYAGPTAPLYVQRGQ